MRAVPSCVAVGLMWGLAVDLAGQVQPPPPVAPVPAARHLQWQGLGYYMFVHFNMNTFTDVEWGDGREDPSRFAPTELDCEQWARVARAAGMKGIILTAKHHDGFCLWPTETTEHHVGKSDWRGGAGDVLEELATACRRTGLQMGLYLSPWDRNHPDYGESERYNAVFCQQLDEILTRYGEVFEVWFDGACGEGPTGKRQVYDWEAFVARVRDHQPGAVIFSDAGPDIRWVGNERGFAAPTNWAPMERDRFVPGDPKYAELTEGHENGTHWVPAECDVSIRPGWYYHPDQDDDVKSLDHLLDIYYGSVGRNANLLLNIPVDRRGLVHENDEARLMELASVLRATFEHDLAANARASADRVRGNDARFGAENVLDGEPTTYWCTDDGVTQGVVTLSWDEPQVFDRVWLAEHVALGQRVQEFEVQARVDGEWRTVAEETTIGFRRILRIEPVRADGLRIAIERAKACPTLERVSVHASPPRVSIVTRSDAFYGSALVDIECARSDATVHFTLDGSEPTRESPRAQGALVLARSAELRVRAFVGEQAGPIAARSLVAFGPEDLRAPIALDHSPLPGLRYAYFEGGWQALTDLPTREPIERGFVDGIRTVPCRRDEHVALVWEGLVHVPRSGLWHFETSSDDGSRLWIGEDLVVDNDGLHGVVAAHGSAPLAAGWHPIRVAWFNAKGGGEIAARWAEGDGKWGRIPGGAWGRDVPEVTRRK